MVRMIVAETSEVVREGLRKLTSGSGVEVTAEAVSVEGVLEQARECWPDVVLLGFNGDALAALGRLKMHVRDVPVLMYCDFDHPTYMARAVALGASGLVLKSTGRRELLAAIQGASTGQGIWTAEQLRRAAHALCAGPPPGNGFSETGLTRRELDVLKRITRGLSNRDIADDLDISYETVRDYVHTLLRKLGLADRTQAAVWAARKGLA